MGKKKEVIIDLPDLKQRVAKRQRRNLKERLKKRQLVSLIVQKNIKKPQKRLKKQKDILLLMQ